MSKEEAWQIIDACKNWNVGQLSILLDPLAREEENKVHNAKRAALSKAWKIVGELNENI